MDVLRGLIAMIGSVLCFVGLISVGASWLAKDDATQPWMMTIIGALMFVQAIPLGLAQQRKRWMELRKEMKDR